MNVNARLGSEIKHDGESEQSKRTHRRWLELTYRRELILFEGLVSVEWGRKAHGNGLRKESDFQNSSLKARTFGCERSVRKLGTTGDFFL